MTDILLTPEVVLAACFESWPDSETARQAITAARQRGDRLWQYVGTVATLHRSAREWLTQHGNTAPATLRPQITAHLQPLADSCQWLAALAEDGPVFDAPDPGSRQLLQALQRLGPEARLLAVSKRPPWDHPQTVALEDYLQQPSADLAIEFMDLRLQQDAIRPQLEHRIHRVLHHGQYILGPEVEQLERRLAEYVGVRHCVSVASGTDSLLIALMALKIGPGDEVITVPYTWISTAEVIALLGARPVFVDVDPATFNLHCDQLEGAITPRTKAILPVSLYGQCADLTRIREIADRHGLPIVEDAAQSFGATHWGERSGGLTTFGSTSFYPSKPLGCYGDGGAIFTDDDALADVCRQIRMHGQKQKHVHDLVGINGRLDTLQAAILLAKLDVFDDECAKRVMVADRYSRSFHQAIEGISPSVQSDSPAGGPWIQAPQIAPGNTSVYAQYTILSPWRDAIAAHLRQHDVPCVTYYARPLHLQRAFLNLGHSEGDFPGAERCAVQGLSLPMSPSLCAAAQQRIVDLIIEAVSEALTTEQSDPRKVGR